MPIGSNAESAYTNNELKIYSSLLGQSNSELTTKLLKVTENLCKDYLSFGISQDDLWSGAYQGLVMACQNYDTNANNFLTFASHWIHIAILSELINYHFSVVPPLLMEQYKIVKNRLMVFQQKYPTTCGAQTINTLLTYNSKDYHANTNELDIVEYTNEKVFEALDINQQTILDSLCEQDLKRTIELLINRLPENKKNLISMYWGLNIEDPMSLTEIAVALNISYGYAYQLYRATMWMLKEYLRGTVSTLDLCLLDERSKKILEIFMQPSSHKHDEEELGWSPDEEYKVLKLLI